MNPTLSGIIAILLWSISPLLIIGAGETPPFLLGFLTLSIASITLTSKNLLIDKIALYQLIKHSWTSYAITLYGIGGYIIFWFLAFNNAPAFEANTLNYLWPLILVCLSIIFTKEQFSYSKIIGIILGFIGCILLFKQSSADINVQYTWGYIFAIIGAFIWASYSIGTKFIKFPNYAMSVFMITPAIFCLIAHLLFEEDYIPQNNEIIAIFTLGLTRISFCFWDYAMKNANITLISSLSYFIPVISTIFLVMFGHSARNESVLLSCLLIICGCLISNKNLFMKK